MFSSPKVVRVITSRGMTWVRHVARMRHRCERNAVWQCGLQRAMAGCCEQLTAQAETAVQFFSSSATVVLTRRLCFPESVSQDTVRGPQVSVPRLPPPLAPSRATSPVTTFHVCNVTNRKWFGCPSYGLLPRVLCASARIETALCGLLSCRGYTRTTS